MRIAAGSPVQPDGGGEGSAADQLRPEVGCRGGSSPTMEGLGGGGGLPRKIPLPVSGRIEV